MKKLYRKILMNLWLNCFGKDLDNMLFRYPKMQLKFSRFFERLTKE